MPRMRAPYTGVVFDVHPDNVEKRLARGFALLESYEPPAPEPEPEPEAEPGNEPEADEAGEPEATAAPTEESTIAEIRAYAKAHGIETPKRGTKAELLELVGAVESDG